MDKLSQFATKNKALTIVIVVVVGVLALCCMCFSFSLFTTPSTTNAAKPTSVEMDESTDEANEPTSIPTVEATSVPTPTVKPMNVVVTSQIVKKVDGKCRYFFDIRNQDTVDFSGSVTITLHQKSGSTLGEETFTTNDPFSPGIGSSQYMDINTCPVLIHGEESGITSFKYTVKVDESIVKSGEDVISDKYEDLDF